MSADYEYRLADCDVADKRALESYRAKRTQDDAYKLWHQLSDDSKFYLEGVETELIQRVKAAR
jgi:hypothetical protein